MKIKGIICAVIAAASMTAFSEAAVVSVLLIMKK